MPDIRYQIAIDRRLDAALSEDAAEIGVEQSIEGPTTFRVKFAVDICDGDLTLLEDERLTPGDGNRQVTVIAFIDGEPHVLAHGIITERQVSLTEGGAGSFLEIRGTDRRAVMARKQECKAHSGRASEIVAAILSDHDFQPDVAETEIQYDEDKNTLNQSENDLEFVEKLAGRNGMRFWIDWTAESRGAFVVEEVAHFRPSPPQPEKNTLGVAPPMLLAPDDGPELKVNAGDGCSNLASFELNANAEAPNSTGPVERVDPSSGEVDETEVAAPTTEPLGEDAPPETQRSQRVMSAGDAQEAQVRNEAAVNDASWSVQATAETSVHALGGIVAPHQVVRVTGGGRLNSGGYLVKSVSHGIDASDHKLRIELLRNALGAA